MSLSFSPSRGEMALFTFASYSEALAGIDFPYIAHRLESHPDHEAPSLCQKCSHRLYQDMSSTPSLDWYIAPPEYQAINLEPG